MKQLWLRLFVEREEDVSSSLSLNLKGGFVPHEDAGCISSGMSVILHLTARLEQMMPIVVSQYFSHLATFSDF